MPRLLPVIAPLERALRVHQDVGDVLHIAHLLRPATYLEEGVVRRGARIHRIEEQAVRESGSPPCRELPVLALDVVDHGGIRPGEERRHNEADALARAGRGKGHDVLGAIVAEVVAADTPEEDAGWPSEPRSTDIPVRHPVRRAVGRHELRLASPPNGAHDRGRSGEHSASPSDRPTGREDLRGVGLVGVPPLEEPPGVVDRNVVEDEPGCPEAHLVAERRGGPLRGVPDAGQDDPEDDQDLADENLGRGHAEIPPLLVPARCLPARVGRISDL